MLAHPTNAFVAASKLFLQLSIKKKGFVAWIASVSRGSVMIS
jgi:hypothetical protein